MREKLYKTSYDACEHQQKGECAVHTKKGYVNIRVFPPFKNPFVYSWKIGLAISFMVGILALCFDIYISVCLAFLFWLAYQLYSW